MALPSTPSRDAARVALERRPAVVLELDLTRCTLTFGTAPCTATGTHCYNTRATCKDPAHFTRGVQTLRFCTRGMPLPPGETLRPYIIAVDAAVTEIDPEKGLARRASLKMTLADEPDSDTETDPYVALRGATPQGTFWARLVARNPHYVGRVARVRRGYVTAPWTWDTFIDEVYVVERLDGPDGRGQVVLTLKDPLKLADRAKVPAPTSGKLAAELKGVTHAGQVVSATSTTVVLPDEASAADGAYTGEEIVITGSTGAGQRRAITAYVGATRTATVAAWAVLPEATSTYEISPLSLLLGPGQAAQYPDPVSSGRRQFVRVGEEVVEYTGKSGDRLTWPAATYRGQFGTRRGDRRSGDGVQLCRAFLDVPYTEVVLALLNESGISDAQIDTASLTTAEAEWYGPACRITACLAQPESPSTLLEELLPLGHAALWWSPQTQQVVMSVLLPRRASVPEWTDAGHLVEGQTSVQTLDELRQTEVALYYDPLTALANMSEAKSFARAELAIDQDAESLDQYGDSRVQVHYTRWLGRNNETAAAAFVARRLGALRDAPRRIKLQLDPKDYTLSAGDLSDVTTRHIVDATGAPKRTRVLLTKVEDRGATIAVEARTTGFAKRYGFIAPNGVPNYPTGTDYAYVGPDSGAMSDGGERYWII
jgi:hypothetical protein